MNNRSIIFLAIIVVAICGFASGYGAGRGYQIMQTMGICHR